jgi:hypothetical protein
MGVGYGAGRRGPTGRPHERTGATVSIHRQQGTRAVARRLGGVAAMALLGLTAVGCGGGSSDKAAEQAIQDACANSGQNCSVDVNGNAINVSTADGAVSVDANGNVVVKDANGNVVASGNAGDSSSSDANSSASGDDQQMTITNGTDTFNIGSGGDIPDSFPSDVPLPDDYTVQTTMDASGIVSVSLLVPTDLAGSTDSVKSAFEAAGWNTDTAMTSTDGSWFSFTKGTNTVSVVIAEDATAGGSDIIYSVTPTG